MTYPHFFKSGTCLRTSYITQLHNFCIYFINVLSFCHCICYLVFHMLFPSISMAVIEYVLDKGYFSEAFLFKPRGGRSPPSGLNKKAEEKSFI